MRPASNPQPQERLLSSPQETTAHTGSGNLSNTGEASLASRLQDCIASQPPGRIPFLGPSTTCGSRGPASRSTARELLELGTFWRPPRPASTQQKRGGIVALGKRRILLIGGRNLVLEYNIRLQQQVSGSHDHLHEPQHGCKKTRPQQLTTSRNIPRLTAALIQELQCPIHVVPVHAVPPRPSVSAVFTRRNHVWARTVP